ncbi:unnamed protein product [Ambrosiozyma monospora]|uniref:Unnamed protein product n=1 Tax=Ambrosiozyma monospora TaxID=43982 RepID=A0A9W6YZV0_AMBMO|nr:unnamed protein product [Ambrosiozyma monospora]
MTTWTPDPTALDQLVLILSGTLASNANIRLQATEALQQAKIQPDFHNYLLHILIRGTPLEPQVRASAGLLMKNELVKNWRRPNTTAANGNSKPDDEQKQQLQNHILAELPLGLLDQDPLVRNITGNVITALFSSLGVTSWPAILPCLMQLASGDGSSLINSAGANGALTTSRQSQEGAMGALSKICEDSSRILDREYGGERPLNFMVPRFIELMGCGLNETTEQQQGQTKTPQDKVSCGRIREYAVNCINQFLLIKTQSILIHLEAFMERLFALASDDNPGVRTKVCSAFAYILDAKPEKLIPHLDGVINYCVHSMQDENEEVSLEACEFLLALATSDLPSELFVHKFDVVLPVLLTKMVYSEMDVFMMENDDEKDNADVADRDEDIKPQMAKSKDAHKLASSGHTKKDDAKDGDDEDSDDEDDDDDDDGNFEWNLRKCSAAAIDVFATNYPMEVLQISMPIIKERIVSQEWPVREASILAMGAIAEGCLELASDSLPSLVPFLIERLQDDQPRVRQISCWTLGRYSRWVCAQADQSSDLNTYFYPTYKALMVCALDSKKVVQEGACAALADYIDSSSPNSLAYLVDPLLQHFQLR